MISRAPMWLPPIFLSTPSARRATTLAYMEVQPEAISIHALREEGDQLVALVAVERLEFLSTPSARRATKAAASAVLMLAISIHALREEGDQSELLYPTASRDFYPRPPRGGRQQKRRKTSPLLFHYKTICTDLEELVQKHPKKQL